MPSDTQLSPLEHQQRLVALWQKPVLTFAEVSDLLSVPRSTLAMLRHLDRAPKFYKIGRQLRANTEDVRAWLASKKPKTVKGN